MGKPKSWLVLFSPAGEVRHQYGLVLVELLCNCGKSEIWFDDEIVSFMFPFFSPPTEQLPYLGGFYHQGRQTAVAAQVRVRL